LADIVLPWRPDPDTTRNIDKLADIGRAAGSFIAGPGGAAGFLLSFFGGGGGQPYDPPHYTVHVDPDSGLVSIGDLEGSAQASKAIVAFNRSGHFLAKRKPEDQAILQRIYETGKMQPGLSGAYASTARALIEIRALFPDTPFVPPDGTGVPGVDARVPFGIEGGAQRSPPGPEFFMPRLFEVPPGGFAAFAQQTVAGQRQQTKAGFIRAASRRRKKAKSSTRYARSGTGPRYRPKRKRSRKVRRSRSRPARMVKGSSAAKAFMKRLRNMQKGKRRRRRRR